MSVSNQIKHTIAHIPPIIGIRLNTIPFKYRLGRKYSDFQEVIDLFLRFSEDKKLDYIRESFQKVSSHFIANNSFYRSIYETSAPQNQRLHLPILTKSNYKETPIESRTISKYASTLYNTGGTTGNPLAFYVDKHFYAREWAHMHYIWAKIGYHFTDRKITIRGKNINSLCKYNFNQNEFLINAYRNFENQEYKQLLSLFIKYKPTFIHGYPSAIYSFLKKIENQAPDLLSFLQKEIKGVMFGSEYPLPKYRDYVENILTENTISWYGHTEGVILAAELEKKYEYIPFLSYGYAEAIPFGEYHHLVGTNYHNLATPFIRYDTEDLIEPTFSKLGILEKFKIKEGRIGEFVVDKNGNEIALTALIHGSHHALFNLADFIQVKQPTEGQLIIYFSAPYKIENPKTLFNTKGMSFDFQFEQYTIPVKTALGKIPLLIK